MFGLEFIGIFFVLYFVFKSENEATENKAKKQRAYDTYQASRPKKPEYYPGTQSEWEIEEEIRANERKAYDKFLLGDK